MYTEYAEFEVRGPIGYSHHAMTEVIVPLLLSLDEGGHLRTLPQEGFSALYSLVTTAIHPNVTVMDKEIRHIFCSMYTPNPFNRLGPTIWELKNQVSSIGVIKAVEPPGYLKPTWRWELEHSNTLPIGSLTIPEGSPSFQRWQPYQQIALVWDIYDSEVVFKHPLVISNGYGAEMQAGVLSLVFSLP